MQLNLKIRVADPGLLVSHYRRPREERQDVRICVFYKNCATDLMILSSITLYNLELYNSISWVTACPHVWNTNKAHKCRTSQNKSSDIVFLKRLLLSLQKYTKLHPAGATCAGHLLAMPNYCFWLFPSRNQTITRCCY